MCSQYVGVAGVNRPVTRGENSMAGIPRTTNQSLILTIISLSVQITHEKLSFHKTVSAEFVLRLVPSEKKKFLLL